MTYRHKTTGAVYRWLAAGYDVTHSQMCVIYCPDDNEHSVLLMEQCRFDEEMEPFHRPLPRYPVMTAEEYAAEAKRKEAGR